MKFVLFFIFLIYGVTVQAQADPLFTIDIDQYVFGITVREESDSIYGEAILKGKTSGNALRSLRFNLKNKDKFGKGMTIFNIKDEKDKKLTFTHKNDIVFIPWRKTKSTKFEIKIEYAGIPANGLIIGKNKFGDKTWFGDNWPNRAQYWLPCVDHPNDKAKVTWVVNAPNEFEVVANGIKRDLFILPYPNQKKINYKTWVFEQQEPIPTKVTVIGIAKLERKCSFYKDSIEVCNYYYPQTFQTQPNKMDVATEIMAFFEKTIGQYPYQKLNNVQSTTMFGGMENANNIFYDEHTVDDTASMEALIAHEIAHQWFGNTVTEKDFSHLWLSEGFATFFTNYYLEKKYGVDVFQARLNEDKLKVVSYLKEYPRKVVDSTKDYMSLLNANSYQKGGLFLQALRLKVGESTFLKIIQTFYNQYKFSNANTNDFKAVAEFVSQQNLTALFNAWLYSTKLPNL